MTYTLPKTTIWREPIMTLKTLLSTSTNQSSPLTSKLTTLMDTLDSNQQLAVQPSKDVLKNGTHMSSFFKTGSEHTLEGKRYDLELQIVHVPHVETEEENKKAGDSAKHSGPRSLAGVAAAEASSASGDDSEDFKSAFISILFSISDYDEVSPDIKERFINFFNDLHFERENPVIDKV